MLFQPEQADNGLGVADRASQHHPHRFGQRYQSVFDHLVLFRLSCARLESFRPEYRHSLGYKPRAGIEAQDPFPALGCVAGFFQQFPLVVASTTTEPVCRTISRRTRMPLGSITCSDVTQNTGPRYAVRRETTRAALKFLRERCLLRMDFAIPRL